MQRESRIPRRVCVAAVRVGCSIYRALRVYPRLSGAISAIARHRGKDLSACFVVRRCKLARVDAGTSWTEAGEVLLH